MTSKART